MTRSGIESLAIVTAAVAACAIAGVGIGAHSAVFEVRGRPRVPQ